MTCAEFAEHEDDAWDKVSTNVQSNFDNDNLIVIEGLDKGVLQDQCEIEQNGEVELISYHTNRLVVSSNSQDDGWLLISDTWYPGWISLIDGNKTDVLIGNYLFKAIQIPAGDHIIEVIYHPISFHAGLSISVVGIILLFIKRKEDQKTKGNYS